MTNLLDATISGILLGGVYGLGALGMSLIFGVMGILNLAHGAFMLLGAAGVWTLQSHAHIGMVSSVLAVTPAMFAVGLVLGRYGLSLSEAGTETGTETGGDPDELSSCLLVTLGFSLMVDDLVAKFSSQGVFALPLDARTVSLAGIEVDGFRVALLGSVLSVFVAFSLVLRFTDLGRMVRACTQEKVAAVLMGISYPAVSTVVFAAGCAMAGLAGGFYLAIFPVQAHMSVPLTIKALLVVVLGGMGRILYTLVAAFVLGLGEVLTGFWAGTESQALVPYLGMLAVLLVWPEGIGRSGQGDRR